jgi:hypothetical protein
MRRVVSTMAATKREKAVYIYIYIYINVEKSIFKYLKIQMSLLNKLL